MLFLVFFRAADGLIMHDVDIEAKLNMNTLTTSVIDENFRNIYTVQSAKRIGYTVQRAKRLGFTPRRISVGKRFRSSFKGERDLAVNSL